jgi:TRAP-type C4-dicarboxylate transport system permease small subunit
VNAEGHSGRNWLSRLSSCANRLTELALLPITVVFVVIIFSSVLTRFVFHYPIVESVELARLAFVWAMLLACAIGVYRQAHVAIFNFRDRLSSAWLPRVASLTHVICATFGALMFWYGVYLSIRVWATSFPTLGWSQAWLYLPLAVSGALITLHGVSHAMTPQESHQA